MRLLPFEAFSSIPEKFQATWAVSVRFIVSEAIYLFRGSAARSCRELWSTPEYLAAFRITPEHLGVFWTAEHSGSLRSTFEKAISLFQMPSSWTLALVQRIRVGYFCAERLNTLGLTHIFSVTFSYL